MCYNCGCKLPNEPHGKGKVTEGGTSLTEDDLKKIAEGWSMTKTDTKKNIDELLTLQKNKSELDKPKADYN